MVTHFTRTPHGITLAIITPNEYISRDLLYGVEPSYDDRICLCLDPDFVTDEGRRLSKTEEAIRNLNLTKFLPSVPLSKFYVRPEFDLSGNRIFFDDEGQDLEDSATQVPPQKSRPETSRPKPRGFPESERSQNVLFSEPDHILKVTELVRGEDSDHHNFIVPGVVNAGEY